MASVPRSGVTLSGDSLSQTVHTHCASAYQAAKLVAALLRVAGDNCRPGGGKYWQLPSGHTMWKQGSCLEKEIMQGTMPGARRRGRSRTAWMDNIKTWTGLSMEESIRMTEDRDKWRKYIRPWCGQPSDRGRLKNTNRIQVYMLDIWLGTAERL